MKFKAFILAISLAISVMILPDIFASESPKDTIKKAENTEAEVTKSPDEEIPVEIDYTTFTDDEFKINCYELWYNDIFFGDVKELRNKLCRLELFVEEIAHVDTYEYMGSPWTGLRDDYGVNGLEYLCGVKREPGGMSYVGQSIIMMEGTKYDCQIQSSVYAGDHLVVYGEIIYAAKNYWSGYNSVIFMPRIITNYGQ